MTDEIWEVILCGDELCSGRQYKAGRKAYRRAVRLSAAAGVPRVRALAAERLVRIDMLEGRHRDALGGIELVIGLWEQLGELGPRAQALRKKAEILVRMDRVLDARLAWREARAALRDHGSSYDVLHCDSGRKQADAGCAMPVEQTATARRHHFIGPAPFRPFWQTWPRAPAFKT